MEEVIKDIQEQIDSIIGWNLSMDETSWCYEDGVLISGNDAKKIIDFYNEHKDKSESSTIDIIKKFCPDCGEEIKLSTIGICRCYTTG